MRFFLDTANIKEIREVAELGLLDGVTTNPSLIAKEKQNIHAVIREICEIVEGPVSAEVIATTAPEMIAEGRELAALGRNVVVKVPMTLEGLKAVHGLSQEDIPTNVTLVFSANQALLCAKAGAWSAAGAAVRPGCWPMPWGTLANWPLDPRPLADPAPA